VSGDRSARGEEALGRVDPDIADRMRLAFSDLAPDLPEMIVDFAYGEVIARPGLDPAKRQLVTITALTVLGAGSDLIETHARGALRVGLTREEVVECVLQCAPLAGFPRAIAAMSALRRAFAE
jgi:4-carboxymuconolactone decarboxylase